MGNSSLRALSCALAAVIVSSCLGCEPQNPRILPADSTSNIEVNAAIRIQYHTKEGIRASDLKASNFTLAECEAAAAASEEDDEKAESSQTSKSTAPVHTKFFLRAQDAFKRSEDPKTPDEKVKRDEIVLVPVPASWENPPLEPATRYCITIADVREQSGKVIPGRKTSFVTENSATFYFRERAQADVIHPSRKPPVKIPWRERIIIEFDGPVHPSDVESGTKLCRILDDKAHSRLTVTSDDPCHQRGGVKADLSVFFLEEVPENDWRVLTSSFKTYGVHRLQPASEYLLIPDLGKDGGHVDGIPFDFSTLDVDDKARPHWEDFTNSRALVEVPLRAKER